MEYIIAGIRIAVPQEFTAGSFGTALAPFAAADEGPADLSVETRGEIRQADGYRELDEFDFADADADCRFGRDSEGYLLTMTPRDGCAAARFRKAFGAPLVTTDVTLRHNPALFRFGLWSMFNIAAVARQAAGTGLIDVLMFSLNPCYDLLPPSDDVDTLWADESYAQELHNIDPERQRLYEFCEREGIAIDVMKAYGGGDLLSDANSPFGRPMTPVQCLEYALTRPGVAAVMAGCRSRTEIEAALAWCTATAAQRDYTQALTGLGRFSWEGHCMYCGHCAPCTAGIDIASVNKYYNLTLAQDEVPETVREHYNLLAHHASECIACGRCEPNCPFGVDIVGRMQLAAAKFGY